MFPNYGNCKCTRKRRLTDTDFLGRQDWGGLVFADARVGVTSAADWEGEVVTVGVRERPVERVARVPGAQKGQRQSPVVVRHRCILHALNDVSSRNREPVVACPPVQSSSQSGFHAARPT